jgi:hypothetical protein
MAQLISADYTHGLIISAYVRRAESQLFAAESYPVEVIN